MFSVPPESPVDELHPLFYYDKLLAMIELAHLATYRPAVGFLFRHHEIIQNQRRILGTCAMPSGKLMNWLLEEKLSFTPVYLVTLEAAWWEEASPRQREILMFHEMQHTGIAQDKYGCDKFDRETVEPIWALVWHDVE